MAKGLLDGAGSGNPNVPEPKIERKYFCKLNRAAALIFYDGRMSVSRH
jgi:hypothetical protein